MSTTVSGTDGVDKVKVGALTPANMVPNYFYAALAANVLLNNTGTFFDGPKVSQGNAGIWFVTAKVSVADTGGAAGMQARLTDGTTVIDRAYLVTNGTFATQISLSGVIANPVGDLKVTVRDISTTGGSIAASAGDGNISSITAIRIG